MYIYIFRKVHNKFQLELSIRDMVKTSDYLHLKKGINSANV